MRRKTGQHITISTVGEHVKAFVPDPLPPKPNLHIIGDLQDLLDRTLLALGQLDGMAAILPQTDIFLYMYIRKEAVLSSQIEGIQSSLSELLLFEIGDVTGLNIDDVQEVSNYVAALYHGLEMVRKGLPVSIRLIREIHSILLSKGRGHTKNPGQFRTSQNWIGGTRPGNAVFVPPPPDKIMECMGQLEKFINNIPEKTPVLLKAAMVHAQFETVHPFLDGNGRIGRLLIPIILCNEKILNQPLLYLSLYFKIHKEKYYDLLQQIRTEGEWENWIEYFLTAIRETSEKAVLTARKLLEVAQEDRIKIQNLGRSAGSAMRIHQAMLQRPISSIPKLCGLTGLWPTTVTSIVKHLEKIGLVSEITGSRRNRMYKYDRYISLLDEGTEKL